MSRRIWETLGRRDVDGVVWYACDPFPTWYRWRNGQLILPRGTPMWEDEQ